MLLIVDHEKASRPIFRMGLGEQVDGDRSSCSTGSQAEHMSITPAPVARAKDSLESLPGAKRVLRVRYQLTIPLRDAVNLLAEFRIGIVCIKQVFCGIEQIDLVRGDQRAQGEWIVFDLRY